MLHNIEAISGVILAGGKSSRMGTDKGLLKLGQYSVIERIAGVLRTMVDEIVIITNRPGRYAKYGDKIINDYIHWLGPLGGIHAGLVHATHPWVLVTACDMPFISAPVARLMMHCAANCDVVVPRHRGYAEPLYALYNKSCLEVIEQHLYQGQGKITLLYDKLRVRYVEDAEMSLAEPHLEQAFANLNTPKDLMEAQTWTAEIS